jgi:hypothetical protein
LRPVAGPAVASRITSIYANSGLRMILGSNLKVLF